jgi:hypothetical protein
VAFGFMICYLIYVIFSINHDRINKNKYIFLFAVYFFVVFIGYGMTGNPLFDYSILIPFYISISIILNVHRERCYD